MLRIKRGDKALRFLCMLLIFALLAGCQTSGGKPEPAAPGGEAIIANEAETNRTLVEKGLSYSSKEEVAAYLHSFSVLPPNFITKSEAQNAGWDNSEGNLWQVTDQKSIGGDHFGNREGLLPVAEGRKYFECDINYKGGYRGAERIVYSNDGLIFYTGDHYETFERLY